MEVSIDAFKRLVWPALDKTTPLLCALQRQLPGSDNLSAGHQRAHGDPAAIIQIGMFLVPRYGQQT